jgi:hypothetical protein
MEFGRNFAYAYSVTNGNPKRRVQMTMIPALLLQDNAAALAAAGGLLAFSGVMMLFMLAIMVVVILGFWKVFEKAGQPGWAAIVPIYNAYILLKIIGRPAWWLVLFMIPLVNIAIALIVALDVAKSFGQSQAFGIVMLFLLMGIGYLVLGFGNYRYIGPANALMTRPAVA